MEDQWLATGSPGIVFEGTTGHSVPYHLVTMCGRILFVHDRQSAQVFKRHLTLGIDTGCKDSFPMPGCVGTGRLEQVGQFLLLQLFELGTSKPLTIFQFSKISKRRPFHEAFMERIDQVPGKQRSDHFRLTSIATAFPAAR